MVSQVVGNDSRGGWTQPGLTPSDLSSRSLLQWRRERERAWYMLFFFTLYTSAQAAKRRSFRGVAIFSVSAYLIIVYVTSMNIIHSLSTHSRVQSENLREIELYSARESAVVGMQFF